MKSNYDVVIIGAGIVGLATALQLRTMRQQLKILILEKESTVAQHQTGHNSGVLHSGIYYKPGSLKAKNCVDGYRLMVEFCREHNIATKFAVRSLLQRNPMNFHVLKFCANERLPTD